MSGKLKQAGLVLSGVCVGVLISLHLSATANREANAPLPVEEMRNLASVFNAIKQSYVEPVEDKKLLTNAISGMVSGLDPHSAYLDEEAFKDLQTSTKGEFGGLGIEVGMEDGFVKVVSPIEDTPAFRAGIKSGDLIVKLDETPVKGMTLGDAVKRMRGVPNTKITLTVLRKTDNKTFEVTLTREVIKVRSVRSKLIEPGYGYIRLTQFQEQTTRDLATHLNTFYKEGPLKGLVLDLRNDPGGLLNSAVGVSAAFLPNRALVVYTDGRTEDSKRKMYATPDDYMRGERDDALAQLPAAVKKLPLVVLVNGGSASASEIVAGALQDHKRAVVMGSQTFGKASVQTIVPLSDKTGLKLTTARYYTPNGRSIQALGIVPDVLVDETPEGFTAKHVREADLNRHLSNDKVPGAGEKKPEESKAQESKKPVEEDVDTPRIEFGSKDDFQLQQALNQLKGQPVIKSKAPVASSEPVASK